MSCINTRCVISVFRCNLLNGLQTKMFLGRYRPPRLAYMEDLVLTAVRDIAFGTSVDVSIAKYFSPDSEHLKYLPPSDSADLYIFVRKLTHFVILPLSSINW
jgi:hypothetical protein